MPMMMQRYEKFLIHVLVAAKMESHCSPCVPRPYDAAATGAGGAMRDGSHGGQTHVLLDFIGTRPLEKKSLWSMRLCRECTCGSCETMTSQDRINLMLEGIG